MKLPDTYEEFEDLVNKLDVYLERTWRIGGMEGGDCWGNNADQPVSAEPEPEDDSLDQILEIVHPDCTFMEYRKLQREGLYSYSTDSCWEYYGNYTEYQKRQLNLSALYEGLKKFTSK